MAKRNSEPDTTEPEPQAEVPATVGERLRAAREGQKLSLEDVAAQTRIPQRHLVSLESGDWDSLPAQTYTVGFAKSYAAAVGLDRVEIGEQLREEMGGQRPMAASADVFEPADPRRTMPRSLVIGTVIAAILLIALMSYLSRRALEPQEDASAGAPASTPVATAPPAAPAPAAVTSQGPVVLTATAPAWIQVTDQGKTLFQGELQAGQSYTVLATATAPMLRAGKPEALTIKVGNTLAPQIGPPGKVSTASLLPGDLLRTQAAAQAPTAAPPAATSPPQPRPRRVRAQPAPAPQPPPATPAESPPATNSGE